MNTINQTIQAISEAVRLEYFIKVDDSTGSFHDKQDVKNLIVRIIDEFKMQLIVDLESNNIQNQTSSDEKLYTKEMIDEAWQNTNVEDHVSVDIDSAEFSINYGNKVELDNADVEIEYDDITDSFASALDNAYDKFTKTND